MQASKILYDVHIFDILPFGGIPRYYTEVIKRMAFNKDFEIKIGANYLHNEALSHVFDNNWKNSVINKTNLSRFGRLKQRMRTSNERRLIAELKTQKYDLFHPSFYNPNYLPHLGKTKLIITIYDMIPELYNEEGNYKTMAQNKAEFILRADHIIAISKNSKKDILRFFPELNPDKITPIYLGADMVNERGNNNSQKADYFLYIGSREGYKNFTFLVESLAGVLNENLQLYFSGSPATEKEIELFRKLKIEQFIHNKFTDDKGLAELYSGAKALIFPSEYEGFGLPIIEAFKNSCPVILSESSCFPEIAGDAALYFENKNKNSFLSALKQLENISLVEDLKKKGKERLSIFDWNENARQTAEIYKKVIFNKQ